MECDGCYAPVELDPVKIQDLVANAESYLEDDDGGGTVRIAAVGYDVISALQETLDSDSVPGMSRSFVRDGPSSVLTFAVDGGSARRRDMTAYTVSISTHCLAAERTDLTPILYAFAQEKRVAPAISEWVRCQLDAVFDHTFTVPIGQGVDPATEEPRASTSNDPAEDGDDSVGREPLQWWPIVQVCGTCWVRWEPTARSIYYTRVHVTV